MRNMASLDAFTARAIAAAVASGEVSAREIAEAALDAVDKRDADVQAFLQVTPELALAAADRIDAARAAGEALPPLAGVPLAVKDNMNLTGTYTTCASRMLEHYASPYTATCVQRMLDAGCVPVGKTNMDEFAFGSTTDTSAFHPTNNPWDTARVPGGSSGGSAAAVAAGEVPIALGSDTGGSIRQPAALCGVVGMKPTYGAVSRYGVVAFGSSLDQVGPFGRTVEDVALAMDALVSGGCDRYDSTSQEVAPAFVQALDGDVAGKRVGVAPSLMNAEGLTPEMKQAVEGAAHALEAAGAELVEIDLPHLDAAIAAYYVIGPAERSPTSRGSTAFATAIRSRAVPRWRSRARFRVHTALARRPSVARCSVPICSLRACMTSTITRPKRRAHSLPRIMRMPTSRWM